MSRLQRVVLVLAAGALIVMGVTAPRRCRVEGTSSSSVDGCAGEWRPDIETIAIRYALTISVTGLLWMALQGLEARRGRGAPPGPSAPSRARPPLAEEVPPRLLGRIEDPPQSLPHPWSKAP